jgi:hypothetical protein
MEQVLKRTRLTKFVPQDFCLHSKRAIRDLNNCPIRGYSCSQNNRYAYHPFFADYSYFNAYSLRGGIYERDYRIVREVDMSHGLPVVV